MSTAETSTLMKVGIFDLDLMFIFMSNKIGGIVQLYYITQKCNVFMHLLKLDTFKIF